MDVSSTIFQPIFEGVKQYVVPLFQRSYSWGKKEWMILWTDIKELYDSENPRQHFMGSLVTIPAKSVPEGVAKFSLIDGQQRITTLYLILMAMGDLYKESGQIEKYEEIKNIYLVNPYKKGNDYYKILPTQIDRDVFKSISSNPEVKIEHEIEYHKNIASKELTRCQIPYFMQDVEVKELQIDSNRYMEFKINMYPIELSVLCDSFEIY